MARVKLSAGDILEVETPDNDGFFYHIVPVGDGTYLRKKIKFSNLLGGADHGLLTGLDDDDHEQYILVNGTRPFTNYIDLIEAAEPDTPAAGTLRLYAFDFKGFTTFYYKDENGMIRRLARDSIIIGKADVNITAGECVYTTGSSGNVPTIDKAKADSDNTLPSIGIAIDDIASGAFGQLLQVGQIDNINTNAFNEGDKLYVSATTAGEWTTTPPTHPNKRQEIGSVLVKSIGAGSIQVIARSVFDDSLIDHDALINTHNLTTDIDHDTITNTHNLTSDINHDIDSTVEHNGVGGAVEDNLISFDGNGLPKDSGIPSSDVRLIDTNTTITVGAAKDYATIQEALDSLEGYIITDCTVTIDVDAGSYGENIVSDQFICTGNGLVDIQGDERDAAGVSYVVSAVDHTTDAGRLIFTIATMGGTYSDWDSDDDADLWGFGAVDFYSVDSATSVKFINTWNTARYGSTGDNELDVASIAEDVAGEVYTITFTDTPHGSIVAGMKLNVYGCDDPGGGKTNNGLFWIKSVNAGAKTITVINEDGALDAATPGNAYAVSPFVCFKPNTSTNRIYNNYATGLTISGFFLETVGDTVRSYYKGIMNVENCLLRPDDDGLQVSLGGMIIARDCTIHDADYGIMSEEMGSVFFSNFVICGANIGVLAFYTGHNREDGSDSIVVGCNSGFFNYLFAPCEYENTKAICCDYGFRTAYFSGVRVANTTAIGCTTAYYATQMGYIYAGGTTANLLGNDTDYSPVGEGNSNSYIYKN